jgi:hypothetical protein
MTRFFIHKAWLSGIGLALGLAGMATARRWLVWVAVGCLAAAFVLRMVERSVPAQ